jgi:hypothetical protein
MVNVKIFFDIHSFQLMNRLWRSIFISVRRSDIVYFSSDTQNPLVTSLFVIITKHSHRLCQAHRTRMLVEVFQVSATTQMQI